MSDATRSWFATFERIEDLIGGRDAAECERRVPACPDWTVRDLLAHMVGLVADVLDGDEPDDHHAQWTAAQVRARRGRSCEALLSEWRGLAPSLLAWMAEHGSRPLNDAVIHEQDLRSALGVPGGRDAEGFALVRDRLAGRLEAAVAELPGRPPMLRLEGERWSRGPADAPTRLRASDFDLGRALASRRTAGQLRSWTVAGDVGPYLEAFAGLGPLPTEPLPE